MRYNSRLAQALYTDQVKVAVKAETLTTASPLSSQVFWGAIFLTIALSTLWAQLA